MMVVILVLFNASNDYSMKWPDIINILISNIDM